MSSYIFRIDDISPEMNRDNFIRCMDILNSKGIKPILGIVPDNKDPNISVEPIDGLFWQTIKILIDQSRAEIAQHGYEHVRSTYERGLLGKEYGFKNGSEFAGLPYEIQLRKIINGKEILKRRGLLTTVFMAPNHSFDENTLKALSASGFDSITDGIGLYPFHIGGICFVPQVFWKPRAFPIGIITICFHTNTMSESDFTKLEAFISKRRHYLSFSEATKIRKQPFFILANSIFRVLYLLARFAKHRAFQLKYR